MRGCTIPLLNKFISSYTIVKANHCNDSCTCASGSHSHVTCEHLLASYLVAKLYRIYLLILGYQSLAITQELCTYHNQITGVMNRITMVLHLRNIKFFMTPIIQYIRTYVCGHSVG